MKRWLGLVLLALIAGGAIAAYLWPRQEDAVERAVHRNLAKAGIATDWVTCTEDHKARVGATTMTFYRCYPHGGEEDGVEVCTPFIGLRPVTEAEAWQIPLTASFCQNQG